MSNLNLLIVTFTLLALLASRFVAPAPLHPRNSDGGSCASLSACPSSCCISGVCRPASDCAALIAAVDAEWAGAVGSSCTESTYAECATGCCQNGVCAPHAVCFRHGNENSTCTASSLQQCDSGCCYEGKCAPVGVCFPAGNGLDEGSYCSVTAGASQCRSGCCKNSQCVAPLECFGDKAGPKIMPLVELLPSLGNSSQCLRDYSGIVSQGIACPCDFVFVCGQCIPGFSELRNAVGPMNDNCDNMDLILDSWRQSTGLSPPVVVPPPSKKALVERDGQPQPCVVGNYGGLGGVYSAIPCNNADETCDIVLGVCTKNPTKFRLVNLACPQGSSTPSATAKITKENPAPGPFFDTQGISVPLGTCTPCYDYSNIGGIIKQCAAGTGCDLKSQLCLPIVKSDYDAAAITVLPCSGTQPVGAKVSSAAECATCWADAITQECGPAPTNFIGPVSRIPPGTPSPGVPSGTPVRTDLSGYPSYANNASAKLTYQYLSCLVTAGRTDDLRPEYSVDSNFGTGVGPGGASGTAWALAWDNTFNSICDCTAGINVVTRTGGSTASLHPRQTEVCAIVPQCLKFTANCADGIKTDAKVALGNDLNCAAACDVRRELGWLEASRAWLEAEESMLKLHFEQAVTALQNAASLVASADNVAVQKFSMGDDLASSIYLGFQDAFGTASYVTGAAQAGIDIAVAAGLIVTSEFLAPFLALLGATLGLISEIMSIAGSFGDEYFQVFENAIEAFVLADQLQTNLQQGLTATRQAFRDNILNTINKDRNRLFYLFEMDQVANFSVSTLDYTTFSKFSLAMSAALSQQYTRQLIPSRYQTCTVDQVSGWVGFSGDSCDFDSAGYEDCPAWCGDGRGSHYVYSGNPSTAYETGITQGFLYPTWRNPNTGDKWMYVSTVKTFYWLCDTVDNYKGIDANIMVAAGCKNGTGSRWYCGPEQLDIATFQFSNGYWEPPIVDFYNPSVYQQVKTATPNLFGWPPFKNNRKDACVNHY